MAGGGHGGRPSAMTQEPAAPVDPCWTGWTGARRRGPSAGGNQHQLPLRSPAPEIGRSAGHFSVATASYLRASAAGLGNIPQYAWLTKDDVLFIAFLSFQSSFICSRLVVGRRAGDGTGDMPWPSHIVLFGRDPGTTLDEQRSLESQRLWSPNVRFDLRPR